MKINLHVDEYTPEGQPHLLVAPKDLEAIYDWLTGNGEFLSKINLYPSAAKKLFPTEEEEG